MNEKPRLNRADFYRDVYEVVKLVPKGRVTSYGAIARYLGAAKSARMVGYALNNCMDRADVPAHRVVNRLGLLSGKHHFPTEDAMAERLMAEGIVVQNDQVQSFSEKFWDPNEALSFD
ncbi:MGMT family protein [Pontibacter sp. G13]|uniref:MGMT family protein n=1 Tax=Pontibacter sp. G13 TaxID=3074898 RepID=UPI002889AFE9|nr:MGMT family protein [Pontibacter sp. G13]WNJ20975.1 MGMT family protein [Pontibacter sp. G13]